MRTNTAFAFVFSVLLCSVQHLAYAQAMSSAEPTSAETAATRDTSYIDAQGTAHITRIVPVPEDLSSEARASLMRGAPDQAPPEQIPAIRARMAAREARMRIGWTALCPNTVEDTRIADVPVHVVTPQGMPEANRGKVLINVHGGAFVGDSGSYSEAIPIAGYTHIKVVAVLYRLAPEHLFPAALDDTIAVYKELLKTYKPDHIILYGTSAGAILTAQAAVKMKQLGLPLPAALGIFSALDSFARAGDSQAMFTLAGLNGHLDPPTGQPIAPFYFGHLDPKDPVLSPIYADLHGLPPTLFISSERDALLSGTTNLHRAYLRAGNDAQLVVFDALPHAFWFDPALPESVEASHIMADFMLKHLPK